MDGSDGVLLRYRGRDLGIEDLEIVRATITRDWARGRSAIARGLCAQWDWRQANGAFKEYAARDLLLRLEEAGHIQLPPRLRPKNNHNAADFRQAPLFLDRPWRGGSMPTGRLRCARPRGRNAIYGIT